jgi:tetratricopeptide (TPR) repeat protein
MTKAAYSFGFLPVAIATVLFLPSVASGQRGGGGRSGGGKMTIPVQKSGKVVMEDGTPLPESVLVEAACAGTVLPVARTDSKGGFIIGRGRESDVDARFQSGTTAGGVTAGCWLRARLPGYESSILRVTDSETFDLGTIVLKRPAGIEGTAYSATSLKAPKAAQKALEKAQAATQKKKWDEARPQLEKAVELYPEYAAAWWELGRVHEASGDLAQARNAYERSIKADPKFVRPYLQLSGVFHKEKNWRAAADVTAAAIKLDPYSYAGAYLLNAISNLRLGNMDAAEASAKQAVKLDAGHTFPEAEYTLGLILDTKGDSKGAAEHLRSFLQLAPNSPGAEAIKGRLAELERASGATPAPQQPAPK